MHFSFFDSEGKFLNSILYSDQERYPLMRGQGSMRKSHWIILAS